MIIKADTKKVSLINEEKLISGEFNATTLEIQLSDEFKGLMTFVTFCKTKTMVIDNKVNVPTLKPGICRVGVYGVAMVNDETVLRYSPTPTYINVLAGSYTPDAIDPEIPTKNEVDRIYDLINKVMNENKIKGEKGDKGDPGEKGERGEKGDPGPKGEDGKDASLTDEQIQNISAIANKENKTTFLAPTDASNTLINNNEWRIGVLTENISICFPPLETYFVSSIVFDEGTTAYTISFNHNLGTYFKIIGEDCNNNIFTPNTEKHYTVYFVYDGSYLIGYVSGV